MKGENGMSSNVMNIEIVDRDYNGELTYLYESDCPNIIKKVNDIHGEITDEELRNAIDVLINVFAKQHIFKMVVNIDEREKSLESAKEMTLEDIEEALGYKVKIVSK